jgi:hypothetical protein
LFLATFPEGEKTKVKQAPEEHRRWTTLKYLIGAESALAGLPKRKEKKS